MPADFGQVHRYLLFPLVRTENGFLPGSLPGVFPASASNQQACRRVLRFLSPTLSRRTCG
eukprot:7018151-Heterocapsa_arctica.AAC.1